MYIETMSQVLAPMNKIILDASPAHGVVPYLPLPDLAPGSRRDRDGGSRAAAGIRVADAAACPGPQP